MYRAHCPVMLWVLIPYCWFNDEPVVECTVHLIYSTLVRTSIFAYGVFLCIYLPYVQGKSVYFPIQIICTLQIARGVMCSE